MQPSTHHHVTRLAIVVLAPVSAGLVMLLHEFVLATGINFGLAVIGAFILVPVLLQNLVVPRIAADCPQCGGRSYLKGFKKYTCSRCGHVEDVSAWGAAGRIGGAAQEEIAQDTD